MRVPLPLSLAPALALALTAARATAAEPAQRPVSGPWHAVLESPGGELPFALELGAQDDGTSTAVVGNGPERRPLSRIGLTEGTWTAWCDPFDARLEAQVAADGRTLEGNWIRAEGTTEESRLPFRATAGEAPRFPLGAEEPSAARFAGRWAVRFSSDDAPAVGIFEDAGDGRRVHGTFLTTLGDYRFLAGAAHGDTLELSTFDGAHAFLFRARLSDDGTLAGDFWSRDAWHETWTATLDPDAALPDAFALTHWFGRVPLADLSFPDLEGRRRRLDEREFAGKARMIVLFGTWCPNCYDETAYLVELARRYSDAGLSILGLAFEHGDDLARQTELVRRYREHCGVTWPLLIAGTSDKARASAAFPVLDRVRAYPTTIFLDGKGRVEAVYTGFSGPATGAANRRMRDRFETLLEEMLTRG